MIKQRKISLVLLSVAFVVLACFIFSACGSIPTDYSDLTPSNTLYSGPDVEIIDSDEFGSSAIKLKQQQDVKVMQLTDIHIGNGSLCVKKDRKAAEAVSTLIMNIKPDLIVLTGDIVYPYTPATGSNDNLSALKVIASLVDSFKTPWTMVFGNHDAQDTAAYTKDILCNYLESEELKYCLFKRGPTEITGMGNHFVNIYNADDSFNSAIVCIDSNGHLDGNQLKGYEVIADDQANWYEQEIYKLQTAFGNDVASYMYYHIPQLVYEDAWKAYKNGSADATYHFGWANERDEKVSSPDEAGILFDKILALGSTKAIFCGHNHLNDFSITYKGVRLTFGKSIDYTAYSGIDKKTEQRGSTILTLYKNSNNFNIQSIKLIDIQNA